MTHIPFTIESDYHFNVGQLPPEHRPSPVYDTLFPYYVELCALSQYRGKEGDPGGIPGHGVMYLHGACRDPKAHYPQLCLCEDADTDDSGVGVSVNRYFKNANWMAVPGRKLFFEGNLEPDDRVTEQAVEAVTQQAIDLGLYDGIKFLDDVKEKKPGRIYPRGIRRYRFCPYVCPHHFLFSGAGYQGYDAGNHPLSK